MATMTVKIEPESIAQEIAARVRPYLERNPIESEAITSLALSLSHSLPHGFPAAPFLP